MNVNLERIMAILVIASFSLTSINILIVQGNFLTIEEAIEISRNSELVQNFLEDADRYTLEIHYSNQTDHGVWLITWYIHPEDAVSAFAYVVSHTIDAETGEILREGSASMR